MIARRGIQTCIGEIMRNRLKLCSTYCERNKKHVWKVWKRIEKIKVWKSIQTYCIVTSWDIHHPTVPQVSWGFGCHPLPWNHCVWFSGASKRTLGASASRQDWAISSSRTGGVIWKIRCESLHACEETKRLVRTQSGCWKVMVYYL